MSGVYPDNSVDFKQKLKEFIGNTLLPINQFARGITSKIYIMSDEESQKIIEDFIDFGEVFKEFTDSNP